MAQRELRGARFARRLLVRPSGGLPRRVPRTQARRQMSLAQPVIGGFGTGDSHGRSGNAEADVTDGGRWASNSTHGGLESNSPPRTTCRHIVRLPLCGHAGHECTALRLHRARGDGLGGGGQETVRVRLRSDNPGAGPHATALRDGVPVAAEHAVNDPQLKTAPRSPRAVDCSGAVRPAFGFEVP